ncbi:MAG: hypothetical protein SNH63_06385 [Rikenellaceae bacterium]
MRIDNGIICKLLALAVVVWLSTSCRELSYYTSQQQVVASVGNYELLATQVVSAIPKGSSKSDSLEFVKLYTKRWIQRQVKLREAERTFSSTANDIETMVEEYRQSLLTRRLDQYQVNITPMEPIDDNDVDNYYNANKHSFKLDQAIVKARLLRIAHNHSSESKLADMMKSDSPSSRQDLISTSEKLTDCMLEDFGSSWIDYADFISMLPIVQDQNNDAYMTRRGVQTLRNDDYIYYFDIAEYRRAGDIAPVERARSTIEKILTNQYHQQIIRDMEQQLLIDAIKEGVVHDYTLTNK